MKKIRVYTKSSRLHGCRLHAAVLFAALCLLPSLRGSAQVYAPDKNASKTTEEYLPDGTYVRTESSEQTSAEFITSASKSRRQKKVSQMASGKKGENWALAQSYGKLPNPEKTYKPSKKAASTDPQATDPTVRDGYSRSLSSIHAAYEQLDPQLYPYQPYYAFKDYYVMHTKASAQTLENDYMQLFSKGMSIQGSTQTLQLLTYRMVELPHKRPGYVAWDETLRNAYCAALLTDPASPVALDGFVRTLILDDAEAFSGISYRMDVPEKGIIAEDQEALLPWTNADEYEQMRSRRRDQALCVARSLTPLETISDCMRQWYGDMKQSPTLTESALGYWKARLAYNEIYLQHDQYQANSPEAEAFSRLDAEAETEYENTGELLKATNSPPVAEPQQRKVAASVSKPVVAAVKAEVGSRYEGTVFMQKTWTQAQATRSIDITVLTREYGHRFAQQMRFVQERSGKSWTGGILTDKQNKRMIAE